MRKAWTSLNASVRTGVSRAPRLGAATRGLPPLRSPFTRKFAPERLAPDALFRNVVGTVRGAVPRTDPPSRLPAPVPSSYTLTGSLLDTETDAPLVGLLVEAYKVDAPQDRRLGGTLTDANGAFSLTINEDFDPDAPPEIRST